jgi:hypothetical protein
MNRSLLNANNFTGVGWIRQDDDARNAPSGRIYVGEYDEVMNAPLGKINVGEYKVSSVGLGSGLATIIHDPEKEKLRKEITELRNKFEKHLQNHEKKSSLNTEYITVRNISLEQAKKEIAQYFLDNDGKDIGYDELIETLAIEPHIVIKACQALAVEGKIG